MLNTNKFRSVAKNAITQIEADSYGRKDLTHDQIEMVFMGYVLGNIKGTFVIPHDTQGRYYEVTYSKSAKKMYIDTYLKQGNKVVTVEDN